MDKPTWGCPECGATDINQHVKLNATREGKFRSSGNGWEFEADDEYDRDSIDVDEEGDFECGSCGETFDKPSRVREGGTIRLALKVTGAAFKPDEHGVEQELDDDFSSRLDFECTDQAQAQRLFDTLRLLIKGMTESARAGS